MPSLCLSLTLLQSLSSGTGTGTDAGSAALGERNTGNDEDGADDEAEGDGLVEDEEAATAVMGGME